MGTIDEYTLLSMEDLHKLLCRLIERNIWVEGLTKELNVICLHIHKEAYFKRI